MTLLSNPLLEVKGLSKIFTTGFFTRRQIKAVDNVSFDMPRGSARITTIAGESGSGKTTIARLLLRLEKPSSGDIVYKGKNLNEMSKKALFQYTKEVQPIFQDPYGAFNPYYKVDHVLRVPMRTFKIAETREEENDLIMKTLDTVGLSGEILDKYPHQLSGGERQRLIVSRAFLIDPELIIADEPVSMIDSSLRASILNLILDLKENHNKSFIFITHDLSTAYHLSDHIIILYRGSIVERGEIETVMKNPHHPYLKALLSSVPIPDPEKKWREKIGIRTEEIIYKTGAVGCKFYGRCPDSEDKCLKMIPEFIKVGSDHEAACHLYS